MPDPANRPTMVELPHPLEFPSTRAYTSMKSEAEKVTNPIQSMWRSVGTLASRTLARVTTMADVPMGMLMKKIHRHPMPLVNAPPTSGPMATAPPITAP